MTANSKYRIGITAIVILVSLAVIFDIFSLIPLVGDFVGPIFWVIAGIYFWKKGMGIVNGRRLAVSILSLVAELIPGVQELPAITAGIIAVIVMTRIEDRTGISIGALTKGKVSGGIASPTAPRQPLNQDGVRLPQPAAQSE